jgi:hypothetical protein
MAILLAHHLEELWDDSLKKYDTSFNEEVEKLSDFIKHSGVEIDKIIVTSFENIDWDEGHFPLIQTAESLDISIELQTYAYGMQRVTNDEYSMEQYPDEKENITWCYGEREYHEREGEEQDVLDIDEWIVELKGSEVILVGAFEGECLNDMETILENQEISFHKVDELCVGTGKEYTLQEPEIIDDILNKHFDKIEKREDEIIKTLEKYDCEDLYDLIDKKTYLAKKAVKDIISIVDDMKEELEDNKIELESIDIEDRLDSTGICDNEIIELVKESYEDEDISIKHNIKSVEKENQKYIDNNPQLYPRPKFAP